MGYKLIKMREIRLAQNMSIAGLARAVGCHKNTLANYERGDRIPQLDIAIKIADELGVDVYQLIGRKRIDQ